MKLFMSLFLFVSFCCFCCEIQYEEKYSIEEFVENKFRSFKIFTDVFEKQENLQDLKTDEFQIGRIFGMKQAYEEMKFLIEKNCFIQSELQQ